jgi:hypothetical protein
LKKFAGRGIVRLALQRDACGFRPRRHVVDVVVRFDVDAHADALDPALPLLAVILTQAETGVAGFEHRPEQRTVLLPAILDLESEGRKEVEALLQIIDGQTGHHTVPCKAFVAALRLAFRR